MEQVNSEKGMKVKFEQGVQNTLPGTTIPPKVETDFVLLGDRIAFPLNIE